MKYQEDVVQQLKSEISSRVEVEDIVRTAREVVKKWVDPLSGGKESTNGLIYGLVQSGKTGVLTLTGAMGADAGYRTILVLTTDIDPLYTQTLARVHAAFPAIEILNKSHFKDPSAFAQKIRGGTCAIVTTKNAKILGSIIENFHQAKVRGLSCLIIDDEADQASLNTKAAKDDGSQSTINERISTLREFFDKNTYLQVTATPQALFLQAREHSFRPKFPVLSHPGADYVGGEDFFGGKADLVREFDLTEITTLSGGNQPRPGLNLPRSLVLALDTFMIASTYKMKEDATQKSAFLCHVSTRTRDHQHIVDLLQKYKTSLSAELKSKNTRTMARLEEAYKDLARTEPGLSKHTLDSLLEAIAFYSPGISIKLVNGESDDDVALMSRYNLFVGGNKLGRGVTIQNLLVSYYGRNPIRPNADTVLQHARMYGYRRRDIGLLRLFLPPELNRVFRAINLMEIQLRELIKRNPDEKFRGIFLDSPRLRATRRNVLAPGAVGVYTAGSTYNPAQILRDGSTTNDNDYITEALREVRDKSFGEFPLETIASIIERIHPDMQKSQLVWDNAAVLSSISSLQKSLEHTTGYIYVDRDRDLRADRRETRGIIEGSEPKAVPSDKFILYALQTKRDGSNQAAWWPQIRYPNGQYAFAFAI